MNEYQCFMNLKGITIVHYPTLALTNSARARVKAMCNLNSLIVQTDSRPSAFVLRKVNSINRSTLEIDPRHGQKVEQELC